ncbi:hypothetical protein G6F46_015198 [Rhizopus delemar]|nr:hypothetical protein G6F65_022721 [Rhizopus arrhizus]KAG1582734.1 hypothetical protein G6F46_015198 [Rhizopus delemar]
MANGVDGEVLAARGRDGAGLVGDLAIEGDGAVGGIGGQRSGGQHQSGDESVLVHSLLPNPTEEMRSRGGSKEHCRANKTHPCVSPVAGLGHTFP